MSEEIKKFYRSRTDRVLFGVCGGLGRYFAIDPVLFRLLFVLLLFIQGSGLVLYIIMVVVTPEEPGRSQSGDKDLKGEIDELAGKIDGKARELSAESQGGEENIRGSRNALGVFIVLLGLFLLLRQTPLMAWLDTDIIFAFVIIAIGFFIIFKK